MKHLQTNRLNFRQWKPSDAQTLYPYFQHPDFTKYIGGLQNAESTWRLLAAYQGRFQWKGYSYLAVETKAGHLIGSVGLWDSEPWPELELSYGFLPDFQGQGFGQEAAKAVWTYAWKELEVNTLISLIDHQNLPSIRLAEKLGAIYEKDIELLNYGLHGL